MTEDQAPNEPHAVTQARCGNCGHEWVAVFPAESNIPYGCQGAIALECSGCGDFTQIIKPQEPFHFIVTSMNGATWVKPSRKASRLAVIGLLMEAIAMLQSTSKSIIGPEECPLRVWVTADTEQLPD